MYAIHMIIYKGKKKHWNHWQNFKMYFSRFNLYLLLYFMLAYWILKCGISIKMPIISYKIEIIIFAQSCEKSIVSQYSFPDQPQTTSLF